MNKRWWKKCTCYYGWIRPCGSWLFQVLAKKCHCKRSEGLPIKSTATPCKADRDPPPAVTPPLFDFRRPRLDAGDAVWFINPRTVQNGSERFRKTNVSQPCLHFACQARPSGREWEKIKAALQELQHVPDPGYLLDLQVSKLERAKINVAHKTIEVS